MSRNPPPPDRPKFLADVMLGSLARWLRILGYDTEYDNRISDDELIERCRSESRILLTRDGPLVERRQLPPHIFISSDDLFAQIREVLDGLDEEVDPERLLSRCIECNSALETIPKESARERVPPYVFRTQSGFKRCPACDRLFWGGTHRQNIYERLKARL